MSRASEAAAVYAGETAMIRATIPSATRAFAEAMTAACRRYETAMIADIGPVAAARKGAGMGGR